MHNNSACDGNAQFIYANVHARMQKIYLEKNIINDNKIKKNSFSNVRVNLPHVQICILRISRARVHRSVLIYSFS